MIGRRRQRLEPIQLSDNLTHVNVSVAPSVVKRR